MKKLYVLVRNDISPGLQIAQACHAQFEFFERYPEAKKDWEGNLVVLQVEGEENLKNWLENTLSPRGLKAVGFREPDLNMQLTAVAVGGKAEAHGLVSDPEQLFSSLPLALKQSA